MDGILLANGGGNKPTVDATDPSSAPQDTTLDVRVLGSGFERGAVVRFHRGGKASADVVTNLTTFVDDQELVANITIAVDAVVDLYDVEVTLAGPGPGPGRRGSGADLFAVTQKTNNGGNGGPDTELSISLSTGTVTDDGGGAYVDFTNGVTAILNSDGHWSFDPGGTRTITIGVLLSPTGGTELAAPGSVAARFGGSGCCDLRTMVNVLGSGDVEQPIVLANGDLQNDIKVRILWKDGDTSYELNYGGRRCVPFSQGDVPEDDVARRGHRLRVVRSVGVADTTWTVTSTGPAVICGTIDKKGKKNDGPVVFPGDSDGDGIVEVIADIAMVLTNKQ